MDKDTVSQVDCTAAAPADSFTTIAIAPHSGATATLPLPADMLKAKIHLAITALFAGYLTLSEEWTEDHDAAMAKLKAALPKDYKHYVELADYLPDSKLDAHRKKVLRAGNNAIRELHELVDSLRLPRT